jgi:exopolysaccharide production protein ExoZ
MQYNIQALRAFAAYAVVVHHILFSLRSYIAVGRFFADPHFFATGVNVFFVISGFIMAMTTAREVTPGEFLYRRIVRIVPIYWLLTALTLVPVVSGFVMFGQGHAGTDLGQAMTSFLFIPDIRPGSDVPLSPVLFVGWSLNFEMMFYAIFAAALTLRGDGRSNAVMIAILALWVAHLSFANPYVRWLGDDIILNFAVGIALWRLTPAIHRGLAIPLTLLGIVMLVAHDLTPLAAATAGAGILVLSAVAVERAGLHVGKGWLTAQGDASYSLYLIHPFVLQAIGELAVRTGVNETLAGLCITVVVMFAASVVIATMFHRLVERPITDMLRRRRPQRSAAIAP